MAVSHFQNVLFYQTAIKLCVRPIKTMGGPWFIDALAC